jgi:hypothetical protein
MEDLGESILRLPAAICSPPIPPERNESYSSTAVQPTRDSTRLLEAYPSVRHHPLALTLSLNGSQHDRPD